MGAERPKAVIRVLVTIPIDVDVDGWNAEYASAEPNAQIREAVEAYAVQTIEQGFSHLDCVEVKA